MLQSKATRIEYPRINRCYVCMAKVIVVGADKFWVECPNCFATQNDYYDTPAEAIEKWNKKEGIITGSLALSL